MAHDMSISDGQLKGDSTHLVYEREMRLVCQFAASCSVQSPPIEAAIEAAADRPPVIAK